MAKPRNSSVAEIARRLETTPVPGSPNRISVEQLQAGVSTLEGPAYYTVHGRKHLDRFFAAAKAVGFA